MANSSNRKLVPEAMSALDKFKYEVASEVGVKKLQPMGTVLFWLKVFNILLLLLHLIV